LTIVREYFVFFSCGKDVQQNPGKQVVEDETRHQQKSGSLPIKPSTFQELYLYSHTAHHTQHTQVALIKTAVL
jgi:hypothetical protein